MSEPPPPAPKDLLGLHRPVDDVHLSHAQLALNTAPEVLRLSHFMITQCLDLQ